MTTTVRQGFPYAMVAIVMGAHAMERSHTFAPSNVATLEWKIDERQPMQTSDFFAPIEPQITVKSSGLALRALAQTVLRNSRPLEAWEREDADEFFRSQFA